MIEKQEAIQKYIFLKKKISRGLVVKWLSKSYNHDNSKFLNEVENMILAITCPDIVESC